MSIFNALYSAASGLRAQAFALDNISGNIANSQTAGFKRTDTSFSDLVLGGDLNFRRQTSGSVQAFSRQTNDVGGVVQTATSGTSVAVNGEGFLVVSDSLGESDGLPNFGGDLYTRRGDFEIDKNGYLVNGAGYYLKGVSIDPVTGNPTGSATQPIRLQNDFFPATATTSMDYRANLPATPQTKNYDATDPNSWLLDGSLGNTISADDSAAFLDTSISGEAVSVHDAQGVEHDVQFRWGKVANGDPTATPPTQDSWALYYQSDANATGTDTAWTKVDADPSTGGVDNYSFDSTGKMTVPSNGSVTISGLTIDGAPIGDVTINHGTGLTQYADGNGSVSVKQLTQNGAASGDVVGIEISDGGKVMATYSNGKTRALFQVPLVTFNAQNRLQQLDGGAYAQTVSSGAPVTTDAGAIVGSAIELSNVDISEEFTKMIITQQAYSANTRVISTSDDMIQETLSMIR
jgi:flagellar hook protein FlgE